MSRPDQSTPLKSQPEHERPLFCATRVEPIAALTFASTLFLIVSATCAESIADCTMSATSTELAAPRTGARAGPAVSAGYASGGSGGLDTRAGARCVACAGAAADLAGALTCTLFFSML